jgi:hypothetical protein
MVFELEDGRGISRPLSSNRPDECVMVLVVSGDPVVGSPCGHVAEDEDSDLGSLCGRLADRLRNGNNNRLIKLWLIDLKTVIPVAIFGTPLTRQVP